MVKPVYKRELSHSYLVIEGITKEKTDSYQYQMILKNKIAGLLEASERYADGSVCLYYDISSRQSLEQIYEEGKMTCQQILDVVDNLSRLLESMAAYLLEERFLLLEPAWIYMDLETEQLSFLYYPLAEKEKPIGSIYMPIAEFFLEHVDHKEEKAVSAAYQFYKMSKTENFTIESFRTILEKGGTNRQENSLVRARGMEKTEEKEYSSWPGDGWGGQMGFYEEPAVYEYGRTTIHTSFEEEPYRDNNKPVTAGVEPERGRSVLSEEKGRKYENKNENRNKSRKKNLAGLLAASLAFGIICVIIWYLQPTGWLKTGLFVGLAADGIFLLLFLWKLTAVKEEKNDKKEEERKPADTWDGYISCEAEEYCADTVIFGGNGENAFGLRDISGNKTRNPRLTGKMAGRDICYDLSSLPAIAGRLNSRAQILLPDPSISRVHARFLEKEGRTALTDLNSENGTFINGICLEQNEIIVLEPGDEIRLGNVVLQYEE